MFLLHTTVQAPLAHGGWMAPCTYLLVYWSSRCWGVHRIVQDGAPPPITLPFVRKQKGRVCAPSPFPLPPTGDPWKLHTEWLLTSHCPGLFAGRAWGRRRWEMPPSFWRMRRWEMPPSVWGKRRWEMPPLFWVAMCLAIIWAFVTTGEKRERENR